MDQRNYGIAWQPNEGPQEWAIRCPVEDMFYGGARGGGKSMFLLGHMAIRANALGHLFRGLLFRETMPELDELVAESKALYSALGASWHAQAKTWSFPGRGILRMRFLETVEDARKYQGHGYTDIGGDEIGNRKSFDAIDLLRAAMRSTGDIKCMLRLTGNPGGHLHEALKKRYILPAKPMTPFYSSVEIDGVEFKTERVFIPSKLEDNPHIANKSAYKARIATSGAAWLVKAWLNGDWSGPPRGGLLNPDLINWENWDPQWIVRKLGLHPVCYWDFAVTEKKRDDDDPDYSACVVAAREGTRAYILDVWRKQCAPFETCKMIIAMQRKWNAQVKAQSDMIQKVMEVPLRMMCTEIGHNVIMTPVKKGHIDKVAHSVGYQMLLGSGSVYAPANAPWRKEVEDEHRTFPTQGPGIHDDVIDDLSAMSQDMRAIPDASPITAAAGSFGFRPEMTHDQMDKFTKAMDRQRGETGDGRDDFWDRS